MSSPDSVARMRLHGDVDARGMEHDFAVNVAGSQPQWLKAAMVEALEGIAAYPGAEELRRAEAALARVHGVAAENVVLLAGASEGFARLPQLAAGRGIAAAAVVHPGFSEPQHVCEEVGMDVELLVLDPPFASLPIGFNAAEKMVVIGNPTNPTGVVFEEAALAGIGAKLLVVDEAFLDMVDSVPSLAKRAARDPNILVLRSLTKTWGIAGLRLGYAIGTPETLAELMRGRSHWPMGTVQIAAALAVAEHGEEELVGIRTQVAAERREQLARLQDLGFAEASPGHPQVPFMLLRTPWPPEQAEQVRQQLRAHGISVRRCDTFPGLGREFWRLAVRSKEQVSALITAITTITAITAIRNQQ
ncbi:aminotransferase class I/II-fold pyridoxal phosphate-dependent enzyme [Corynebacterium kozikiae]|uniref:aminotransferase class I/II-fold pyridoxal phosphate-dependent enzyme n=1 Tax=Corynebacterium kozikiae TaxID=2968469 RepID=UPI002795A04E|nr:aminotransferase class I/II-fold pyridoxal phosphate-dependent enzyme [Corynebacterium sp. 76QC2CO]